MMKNSQLTNLGLCCSHLTGIDIYECPLMTGDAIDRLNERIDGNKIRLKKTNQFVPHDMVVNTRYHLQLYFE